MLPEQLETKFAYAETFGTKREEKAEYLEITGTGDVKYDQKFFTTNKIRININLKIKAVTIKADEIEWNNYIKKGYAKNLINELDWCGVKFDNTKTSSTLLSIQSEISSPIQKDILND